jgi:hypothetical protein
MKINDNEINNIANAVYETMVEQKTNYIQSWWLNKNNHPIGKIYTTSQINRRLMKLVKDGFLIKYNKNTSTSTGTCYVLKNNNLINWEIGQFNFIKIEEN